MYKIVVRAVLSVHESLPTGRAWLLNTSIFSSTVRIQPINLLTYSCTCVEINNVNPTFHHWMNQIRYIHSSTYKSAKKFTENENLYAHKILETSTAYSNTLARSSDKIGNEEPSEEELHGLLSKDWCNESAKNVLLAFQRISYSPRSNMNANISSSEFDGIVKSLVKKCPELSDDCLIEVLMCLKKWTPCFSSKSPNFFDLWKAVDEQCTVRMKQWDRNKLLLVADHWYLLYLSTKADFMWHAITRLTRKPENLTPHQLIQTMFFINTRRKIPSHLTTMYDFEYALERCIDKLTIDELAVFAMGFFKTEKAIRGQNLLIDIIRKVMNEVDTIHEISLAALLKIIRYSLAPASADTLYALLDKLMPHIDRLSLMCCTHIALAGSNVLLYHQGVIEKVVRKFCQEIETCRLKDLERMSFALSLYNFEHNENPSIYELITKELRKTERSEEFELYQKCLPCCLHYLSLRGVYLTKEISKVLDEDFLHEVYGRNKHKIGREILNLDASVEVECTDYTGNRLSPSVRSYLAKIYSDRLWKYEDLVNRKLRATDKMLLEVYISLTAVTGSEKKLYLGHVMPHLERADIIFGINSSGAFVDIPSSFKNHEFGVFKPPPDVTDTVWNCVIIGGWNSLVRNTNEPVGSLSAKIRHLKILNYNPVIIPWFEWKSLTTQSEQEKYLQLKIFAKLSGKVKCALK